jgi:hypothetical protein
MTDRFLSFHLLIQGSLGISGVDPKIGPHHSDSQRTSFRRHILLMRKPIRKIILAVTALAAASLACNFLRLTSADPTQRPTVPVSTEAVQDLEQNLNEAAENLQQGEPITLIVTETQLTSLIANNFQSGEGPVLQNPQVYLQDGQVQLVGSVEQSGISLPLQVLVSMRVDSAGNLDYTIDSATLGPFPLPQALLEQLSNELDRAIADQLGQGEERIVLDEITIADGTMVISGHKP